MIAGVATQYRALTWLLILRAKDDECRSRAKAFPEWGLGDIGYTIIGESEWLSQAELRRRQPAGCGKELPSLFSDHPESLC